LGRFFVPETKRVVITGGPGAGKTALVDALAQRGHATVPEAATLVLSELNERLGLEGQRAWRRENPAEFQVLVVRRQAKLEAEARPGTDGLVFLDRGWIDGLAYCRFFHVPFPPELNEPEGLGRYDRVFLLETLSKESFQRVSHTGGLRDEDYSRTIQEVLESTYRQHGYEPIPVPEMPIQQRADLVLQHVSPAP
jgi:predicted ATPase